MSARLSWFLLKRIDVAQLALKWSSKHVSIQRPLPQRHHLLSQLRKLAARVSICYSLTSFAIMLVIFPVLRNVADTISVHTDSLHKSDTTYHHKHKRFACLSLLENNRLHYAHVFSCRRGWTVWTREWHEECCFHTDQEYQAIYHKERKQTRIPQTWPSRMELDKAWSKTKDRRPSQ